LTEQREFRSHLYTECEDPDCPSAYAYEGNKHFHYTGPAEPPEGVVYVHLQRRSMQEQLTYLATQVGVVLGTLTTLTDAVDNINARLKAVERATPLAAPKKPPVPKLPPRSRER
jgi:hypothetical protein